MNCKDGECSKELKEKPKSKKCGKCGEEFNPFALVSEYILKEKRKEYLCPKCLSEYYAIRNKFMDMMYATEHEWFYGK